MTTTAPPASMAITDALWVHLSTEEGHPDLHWYDTEVDDHPPTLDNSDRVAPYGVLYPFPGKPGDPSQQSLDWSAADLDYGCQITVAAGFRKDLEYAVDAVRAWVEGWSPTVAGVVAGQFRPPTGFDPGPIQVSRTISPPRLWLPLQYRLTATTT